MAGLVAVLNTMLTNRVRPVPCVLCVVMQACCPPSLEVRGSALRDHECDGESTSVLASVVLEALAALRCRDDRMPTCFLSARGQCRESPTGIDRAVSLCRLFLSVRRG